MSNIAISVKNLSKRYRIGQRKHHKTLREVLSDTIYTSLRPLSKFLNGKAVVANQESNNTIWALKDVCFDVNRGEVVGIIGPNGAGKSTLLKILTRITEPTEGYVDVYGRVGSLLEVGTGFHSELTGRENIYLNGAILGMWKSEIDHKFDEIVAFSEVEKFLDTPVKHYSSGMYVRLAFAVAAHLEPEILIVDEVLSVGDFSFQKKCIDKMEKIKQQGCTIFFVSHNLTSIKNLCARVILLDKGKVLEDGSPYQAISKYLNTASIKTSERTWPNPMNAPQGEIGRLRALRVLSETGTLTDKVDIRHPLRLEMEYEVLEGGHVLMPSFPVNNEEGLRVFSAHDLDPLWRGRPRPRGKYVSSAWIPGNLLAEGKFSVGAGLETIGSTILQFYETDVVAFEVFDSLDGDTARGDYIGEIKGVMRPLFKWSTQYRPD